MNKRLVTGIAAVAALAIGLTGCARADEAPTTTEGGSSAPVEHVDGTANQINAKTEDELGQGGVLRLYNNAYPANFNTFTADGNEANTIAIMDALYPSLYEYTAGGEIVANELYAQSIEKTSDEPLTFEIKLVEGMQWSDGTPINWQSVKNAVDAMVNPEFNVASREGYDKIESVTQGDNEYHAIVTFKAGEVYADWIGLASVMPDAMVASADAFNTGWVSGPQVTAGPYKIGTNDAANKVITLVPDENWTGARTAKLDNISWQTIEDPSAAATAFTNDQLDVVDASSQAIYSVVQTKAEGDGFEIRTAAGPDWTHLTLNGKEGNILADQNIRQAFLTAVDRKSIFQALNGTMPYPAGMADELLGNHLLVQNQDGYVDNSGNYGKADPEAAKALIEESGWTLGADGYYQKDGQVLEVRYVYNAGSKTNETVAPIVTENLKAAGIRVVVEQVPPTDLFSKYVIPGDYDFTLFGWNGNPFVTSAVSIWKSDGEQNFSGVGNAELDEILAELQRTTDPAAQIDLLNQADVQVWEVAGNLPLYQAYDFIVTPTDLANYGAPGFQSVDWTLVGYVKDSPKLG